MAEKKAIFFIGMHYTSKNLKSTFLVLLSVGRDFLGEMEVVMFYSLALAEIYTYHSYKTRSKRRPTRPAHTVVTDLRIIIYILSRISHSILNII